MIGVEVGAPPDGLAEADRPSRTDAGEAYIKGLGYLQASSGLAGLRSAIEQFERALESDSRHALALSKLASARARLVGIQPNAADSTMALAEAKKAVALDGTLAETHLALGEALALSERHQEAISEFQKALGIDALNTEARQALVEEFVAAGRETEAESILVAHRRDRPTDVRTYREIADFYAARGRFDDAEREYLAALELTPGNQLIPIRIAGLSRQTGQLDRAKAEVERSLAMRASAEGYATLGRIEFQAKRFLQAATAYEMATEMSPSSHDYGGARGDCYRRSPASEGQSRAAFGRAIDLVKRELAAAGDMAEARSWLALYLAKSGQPADGVRELAAIPAGELKGAMALLRAAAVHELAGDRPRASRELRAAIQAGASEIEIASEPDLAAVPR
jgi:tetratricopeptide (TPR) repeat protein